MDAKINIVTGVISQLGESPIWCDKNQQLYYVDILQHRLISYSPIKKGSQIYSLPFLASAVVLTNLIDIIILISDEGIFTFNTQTQKVISQLARYPELKNVTRPNEGAVSPEGDIFFGTMPYTQATTETVGHWYKFSAKSRQITVIGRPVMIPNTLCWHKDKVFFADSKTRTMYSSTDLMQNCEPFFKDEEGISPDGSTITETNELWNAKWGGAKLSCYNVINNVICKEIALPVLNPTSCCFGDENLCTLYVTSSTLDIKHPDHNQGGLLSISNIGKGNKANRFYLERIDL